MGWLECSYYSKSRSRYNINIKHTKYFIEYKFKSNKNNEWFYDNKTQIINKVKNNKINIFDRIPQHYMSDFNMSYFQYDTFYHDDPIQLINILNDNVNSDLVIKICSIFLYYTYKK